MVPLEELKSIENILNTLIVHERIFAKHEPEIGVCFDFVVVILQRRYQICFGSLDQLCDSGFFDHFWGSYLYGSSKAVLSMLPVKESEEAWVE